jgi:hypothetical protein
LTSHGLCQRVDSLEREIDQLRSSEREIRDREQKFLFTTDDADDAVSNLELEGSAADVVLDDEKDFMDLLPDVDRMCPFVHP